MAKKHKFNVSITQMTSNGAFIYAGCSEYKGDAIFTATYNHCYFNEQTLKKVKGGAGGSANYEDVESGEMYRVMKFNKI